MSKSTFKFLKCQGKEGMAQRVESKGEKAEGKAWRPSGIWFPFYPGTIVPPYRAGAVKIAP